MADLLQALKIEQAGYLRRGLNDRAAAVQAEIDRLEGDKPKGRHAPEADTTAEAPRKRRGPAKVTVQGPED